MDFFGVERLSPEECRRILGESAQGGFLGRVGIQSEDGLLILPVRFYWAEDSILFRTHDGLIARHAAHEAEMTFEIDHADHDTREGWSVIVTGPVEIVRDPDALARLRAAHLAIWAGKGVWVAIVPRLLTGRRVNWPTPELSPRSS